MSYTMYTPLNVWLDPASVTDVVAYIQTYLSDNPIYSQTEIETLITSYLTAHPELIGVQSVNGKTGTVVLSASDITTENDVTIESALASLSSQISSIAASVATNTANITSLTGRVSTAETDLSNLKSNITNIVPATPLLFFIGGIKGADGTADVVSNRLRCFKYLPKDIIEITAINGYLFSVYIWNYDGTYLGKLIDDTTASTSGTIKTFSYLDISKLKSIFSNHKFRITIRRQDNTDIQTSESVNISFKTYNDALTNLPVAIHTNNVNDLYALYDTLVEQGLVTKTTLTTVENLPLNKYHVSALSYFASEESNNPNYEKTYEKRKRILLFSGMHGNEKGAVIGLYAFVLKLCNDVNYQKYLAVFDFDIVPICNPTGYNANTRNNYQDININRIDEAETTLECTALLSVVDSAYYDLFIDFHNCPGSYSEETIDHAIGAMSFAVSQENVYSKYNIYRQTSSDFSASVEKIFDQQILNSDQLLFPWHGTDLQTFRNYAYKHNVLLPVGEITSNKFVSVENGNLLTSSTAPYQSATDFVDIELFRTITYKQINSTSSSPVKGGIAFYDKNKEFISGIRNNYGVSQPQYTENTVEIPINAKYVRFSIYSDSVTYGDFSATAIGGSGISSCVETSNYCYKVSGSTHMENNSSAICSILQTKYVMEQFMDNIII